MYYCSSRHYMYCCSAAVQHLLTFAVIGIVGFVNEGCCAPRAELAGGCQVGLNHVIVGTCKQVRQITVYDQISACGLYMCRSSTNQHAACTSLCQATTGATTMPFRIRRIRLDCEQLSYQHSSMVTQDPPASHMVLCEVARSLPLVCAISLNIQGTKNISQHQACIKQASSKHTARMCAHTHGGKERGKAGGGGGGDGRAYGGCGGGRGWACVLPKMTHQQDTQHRCHTQVLSCSQMPFCRRLHHQWSDRVGMACTCHSCRPRCMSLGRT